MGEMVIPIRTWLPWLRIAHQAKTHLVKATGTPKATLKACILRLEHEEGVYRWYFPFTYGKPIPVPRV